MLHRRFAMITSMVTLAHAACAEPSQLAQTSSRVAAPAPPPASLATPERAVVASRSAPVPAVSDPDEVIVLVRAGSVWMMKADASEEPLQLSVRADDAPDRTPTVDSQGKRIIFAAPIEGVYKIHVLSLDDMVRTTVTDGSGGGDSEPTWAPDGKRFAFMRGGPEDQRHLYIHDLGSGQEELIVEGKDERPTDIGMPAWSPDGRTIALVSERRHGKGALIWLVDVAAKRLRRLTPPRTGAWFVRDRDPSFSPDGGRIVFASNRHVNSADDSNDFDIYTIHVDGSGLTRLTSDPGVATDPTYSVDGRRILFVSTRASEHEYESELYVMAAGGGQQRRLTRDERPQNSAPGSGRVK